MQNFFCVRTSPLIGVRKRPPVVLARNVAETSKCCRRKARDEQQSKRNLEKEENVLEPATTAILLGSYQTPSHFRSGVLTTTSNFAICDVSIWWELFTLFKPYLTRRLCSKIVIEWKKLHEHLEVDHKIEKLGVLKINQLPRYIMLVSICFSSDYKFTVDKPKELRF